MSGTSKFSCFNYRHILFGAKDFTPSEPSSSRRSNVRAGLVPVSGGIAGVQLQVRCKTLEEENAELREQLASVQVSGEKHSCGVVVVTVSDMI